MPENMLLSLRGFLIGLSIAAPVGPIGILCIRRTISNGWLVGFVSGIGAATADAVYGSIAAFGLVAISSLLIKQQFWMQLGGGVFLVYLGTRIVFSKPRNLQVEGQGSSRWNLLAAYGSTFVLTLSNPLTILSFLGVFAGLGLGNLQSGIWSGTLMVLGVFAGSASWWLLLSGLFTKLRSAFTTNGLGWVNRISGVIILGFGFFALSSLFIFQEREIQSVFDATRSGFAPQSDPTGFQQALPGKTLLFPQDHGDHPDYQTEWWYFTGNLRDDSDRHFGYQLTFFRRALAAPVSRQVRDSRWGTDQVYLAHFAITNVQEKEHLAFERLSRGAGGVAGAHAEPFEVWLDDWVVSQESDDTYRLLVKTEDAGGKAFRLDLELRDLKGPILQGDQGYSQKGPDPGNASYYYSLTRLQTLGSVEYAGKILPVQGYSWMDHEFSTSALGPDLVGWDWFSIQLDDFSEIMVFQLRNKDGSVDSFSSGIHIDPDGRTTVLDVDDFSIQVLDTWTSPSSGGKYPVRWRLRVPGQNVELIITPFLLDQEMNLSYRYWEGAVSIEGSRVGVPVNGFGYVEMTGYAGSFEGEF